MDADLLATITTMKQYKYILLDWDGNLARTLDIWLAALKVPLEKRGIHRTDEEIGANFMVFKERMEARGIKDVDMLIDEAVAIATREVPNVELYPDVIVVLAELKKAGKRLALVTTSRHDQIDPLLSKYSMNELFDFVVCGEDTTHQKPHPEPLEKALELLDAYSDRGKAVMVGDSSADIEAANNVDIDSILFYPSSHSKYYDLEKLKKYEPTYIVHDLRELLQIAQ
jgi:pyrophosphatase PpaX